MTVRRRDTCRACGGRELELVLSLGETPLANAFLRSPEEFADEPRFPLHVYACAGCLLVQLLDVVDPEVLFRRYLYVTGTSELMARHNAAYAEAVVRRLGLGRDALVVEIASNDGSLLRAFQERGVRALGVEPAENIAELARERGVETICEFFRPELGRQLRLERGPARAVVANNVLAHVDDPQGFLTACAELVDREGLVIVEVPYLGQLVDRLEYDTIYHEHLCYFALGPLAQLFEQAGLRLSAVERVAVHGGSLRLHGSPDPRREGHAPEVRALLAEERAAGLQSLARYRAFARAVAGHRDALRGFLAERRAAGARIAGYGAPAKGNTLLNYCGLGTDLLDYTVDRNPLKVGLYTPGAHLPVRPVEALCEDPPDDLLILAWNFAEEIMRQQKAFARRGGRFVLPVPAPRVVGP